MEPVLPATTGFLIAPSTLRWTHWPALHSWALSAHYDDRPTLGSPPLVRLIVLHRIAHRAARTHVHILSSFSHVYCVHMDRGRRRVLHQARVGLEDSVAHALGAGAGAEGRDRWAVLVLACPLPTASGSRSQSGSGSGGGAHVRPQYVALSAHPFANLVGESGNSSGTGIRTTVAATSRNRSVEQRLRALPRAFVRYPSKPRLRQNFAQCVLGALVYDSMETIDSVRLVEWLELSRALGLSALHLYLYSPSPRSSTGSPESSRSLQFREHTGDVLRVLQHYKAELVHVHRVEPLRLLVSSEGQRPTNDVNARPTNGNRRVEFRNRRALALATLQHCLYENLYAYDKLLVASLRELLVPHHPDDRSLLKLVRRLERESPSRPHPHRNYVFHSAEFYPENSTGSTRSHSDAKEPDPAEATYVQFASLTHLKRSPVNAEQWKPRSLVDAAACVALNAERCTRLTRHANRAGHTLTAHYTIGLLHRYPYRHPYREFGSARVKQKPKLNSTCELESLPRAPGICGAIGGFGRRDETALKLRASFVERALAVLRRLRLNRHL